MRDEENDVVELPGDDDLHLQFRNDSPLRSYLELMRLPNVFTAMADVTMGFLFVQRMDWRWETWRDSWTLAMLIAASSLLYVSGVVLNDVFDLETDRRQRPGRPLPSGRVSLTAARWLGWKLLLLGVVLGVGVGFFVGHPQPGVAAVLLAASILLYDAWLKRTPLGPPAMGACRMLNVLLGMSVVSSPLLAEHWLVAGGIGVYVAGVTWFARRESQQSDRLQLALATLVMILGVAMLAWFPNWSDRVIPLLRQQPQRWYLLTGVLGMLIVWRCIWVVADPAPLRVRLAVAQCVLSLVMLDAVACYAVRGVFWACMILAFLLPAMFLGKWIETT